MAKPGSIWSLTWLIIFWVLTLAASILIFISAGSTYLDGRNFYFTGPRYTYYSGYIASLAWGITFIISNSVTLILSFVAVILYAGGKLTPLYVLVSNVIVLVAWSAMLAASALTPPGFQIFTLAGNCVHILVSLVQVIYSSVLLRQQGRRPATVEEAKEDVPEAAPAPTPEPVVNTVYVPVVVPPRRATPTIDDDDSGFEEPAPDYETVVADDGGVSGSGMQKFNDA